METFKSMTSSMKKWLDKLNIRISELWSTSTSQMMQIKLNNYLILVN